MSSDTPSQPAFRLPFTADDLATNRVGRMSRRQIWRLCLGIPFFWYVPLALAGVVVVAQLASRNVAARPETLYVVQCFYVGGLISAVSTIFVWRKLLLDAHGGIVEQAAGTVNWQFSRRTANQLVVRTDTYRWLALNFRPSTINMIDLARSYRVYYAPRSKVLLSFEAID